MKKILIESDVIATKVTILNPKFWKAEASILYAVQFSSSDNINLNVLNHNHCRIDGNITIKWEALKRSKAPLQCHNCQRWGHTSTSCGYDFRCVKCTENHAYGECKSTSKDFGLPKCINCGENRAANYRQCAHAIKFVSRMQKTQNSKPSVAAKRLVNIRLNSQEEFPGLSLSAEGLHSLPLNANAPTFASKVQPRLNVSAEPNSIAQNTSFSKVSQVRNEINSIPDFDETLKMFSELITKIKSCSDHKSRCKILFEYLCDIKLDNGS